MTGLLGRPCEPLAAGGTPPAPLVVGERQRHRIAGREGLLDGLVELGVLGRHVLLDVVVDVLAECRLRVGKRDPVLRTLGPGDRRHHVGQVELEILGEGRLTLGVMPHALRLGVRLDQLQLVLGAPGHPQVVDGDLVDRENCCGRTEFGAHIAQRGAVGQRHLGNTCAVELDELAHHAVLTEHLGDRQHHVGGGHTRLDLAAQLESHDARNQHRHRLAQHRGLGLDAADAPAQYPKAVDHRGV